MGDAHGTLVAFPRLAHGNLVSIRGATGPYPVAPTVHGADGQGLSYTYGDVGRPLGRVTARRGGYEEQARRDRNGRGEWS